MTTLTSTIADWIAILGSIRFVYTYVKKAIKKRKDENERELRLFKEEIAKHARFRSC